MTWPEVPLHAVAEIQGGIQKQPKRAPRENAFPFLRVANVTASGLDLEDVHEVELFDGELDRFRLQRGDLLVVEGNGSASQIGRAAVWDGSITDAVHQNHLIRVRPAPDLDARYLGLLWNSPTIRDELSRVASSTSGLHTLSVTKLKRIMLPLPRLDEQYRVVDLLEDHLSRLDAADSSLRAQGERLAALEALVAHDLTTGVGERVSLASIARLITDGDHNPPKRVSAGVPHVTAKGIRPDGSIDLHSGTFVSEDGFRQTARRYLPTSGDIIVTCVGTIGRVALVPPGVRFSADRNLAAIRVNEQQARPEFVALALKGTRIQHQLRRASGSTAQPHLYLKDLRATTVELPSLTAQSERVAEAEAQIGAARRLRGETEQSARRSIILRRSLLAAAFSGRLTGAAPYLSEAEEMVGA